MTKRPNILFIMTDQQRWDTVGPSGGWVRTPGLDRIASEGVLCANCVTTTPVCVPARLSLATGLYPHSTGVWTNCGHAMSPDARTWFQAIRDLGYRTSVFGKTHWHPHRGDLRDREHLIHAYGFDDVVEVAGPRASASSRSHMTDAWEAAGVWEAYQNDYAERFAVRPQMVRPSPLGLDLYYDTWVGQQACAYLRDYDRAEPWFCYLSFPGPHEPWDTPEPYASMYDPARMPAPRPAPEGSPTRATGGLDHRLSGQKVALEPDDPAALRANYAGNVSLIDDQISQIFDIITKRGEWDNTIIALTSDHGEMNGDAGLIYKEVFLDGAARVPLLIRSPEMAGQGVAGSILRGPVEMFDVGPTLAELAGGVLAYPQFARSLVPTLREPRAPHRADALSELDGEAMLLTERWKAAVNREGAIYLLFDLETDPMETINLAGSPEMAGVEEALRARLLERLMQSQTRLDLQLRG